MQKKEYEARGVDLFSSHNKSLSIRLSSDGLSFAVFDPQTVQTIYVAHIVDSSKAAIELLATEISDANKVLTRDYLRTFVCIDTERYTLLPSFVAKEANLHEVAKLNFGEAADSDEYEIITDEVASSEVTIISLIPKQVSQMVRRLLPNAEMHSQIWPLISFSSIEAKKLSGKVLHLNVGSSSFDAVYSVDGVMQLCNHFTYRTADEFLYFALCVLDTFRVDQYDVRAVISGDVDEYAQTVRHLSKYIAQMQFASLPYGLKPKGALSSIKDNHQYLILLQTPLCEL